MTTHLHATIYICIYLFIITLSSCETSSAPSQNEHSLVPTTPKPPLATPNLIVIDSLGHLDSITNKRSNAYKRIQFRSLDSLLIDANYYYSSDSAPNILLCHQARWNKYEYDSIAVVLQHNGYNCLAIDQRSGGTMDVDGIHPINATHQRAMAAGLPTEYLDAEQDIVAAIDYFYKQAKHPIIIWGSSYSSTLALYNGLNNNKVFAVVSFSPGNYFSSQKGSLIPLITTSAQPFFITSSKKEAEGIKNLIQKTKQNNQQIQFIPKGDGYHGSRALWASKEGHEEYWAAIFSFLESLN